MSTSTYVPVRRIAQGSSRPLRALLDAARARPAPSPIPPEWTSLEVVRKRPGMYIGDVRDGTGLEHCVWEMAANAVDQHLRGAARRLAFSFDDEGAVEVADDGPGFSLAEDERGVTFLERAVSSLHATATLDGHFPHVHLTSSSFGCGLASVAAVARSFSVETVHGGACAQITMEEGKRRALEITERGNRPRGTRVRFAPDPTIFGNIAFDRASVRARAQEIAWWLPELTVTWQGEELPGLGGSAAWIRHLTGREPLVATRRPMNDVLVDVALGYVDDERRDLRSWVNLQRTREGTHELGVVDALVAIARDEGSRAPRRTLEKALCRGLVARVHVWMLGPEFDSPTRTQLRSPIARPAVARAIVSSVAALPLDAPIRRAIRARC